VKLSTLPTGKQAKVKVLNRRFKLMKRRIRNKPSSGSGYLRISGQDTRKAEYQERIDDLESGVLIFWYSASCYSDGLIACVR
jgi:hypothetical protein